MHRLRGLMALGLAALSVAAGDPAQLAKGTQEQLWKTVSLQLARPDYDKLLADDKFKAAGYYEKLMLAFDGLEDWQKEEALGKLEGLEGGLEHPSQLIAMGKAYEKLGRPQAVARLAGRLAAGEMPGADAKTLMWAAHALRDSDYSAAGKLAAQAYRMNPQDPQAEAWRKLPPRPGQGGGTGLGAIKAQTQPFGWRADPSLSAGDVSKVNKALVVLSNTKTGQKVLVSVLGDGPVLDVKNMDLKKLQEQGKVKVIAGAVSGDKQYEIQQGDGVEVTHVIRVNREFMRNPEKYMAPILGESLDNVSFWRKFKDSMAEAGYGYWQELSGTMHKIWIAVELGLGIGKPVEVTPATRDVDYSLYLYAGDLKLKPSPQELSDYENRYPERKLEEHSPLALNDMILKQRTGHGGGLAAMESQINFQKRINPGQPPPGYVEGKAMVLPELQSREAKLPKTAR